MMYVCNVKHVKALHYCGTGNAKAVNTGFDRNHCNKDHVSPSVVDIICCQVRLGPNSSW